MNYAMYVLIPIVIGGCASTGGDINASKHIINSSTWFMLGNASNGDTYFYDPYQKIDDGNGSVEALIYATKPSSNKIITPDLIKINCDSSLIKLYKINEQGGWDLYQDWIKVEGTSVQKFVFVNGLCRGKTADGDLVELITFTAKPGEPSRFLGWYWLVERIFNPSIKHGKTFKTFYKDPKESQSYYLYMYADCDKKRIAQSSKLSTENLEWISPVSRTSPAGFIYKKACGTDIPTSNSQPNKVQESSISGLEDAKVKCSDLGIKKGTEQYGNCVLKLSK